MTIRPHRKSMAAWIRIRDISARTFAFAVLGLAIILFPLALSSGSVWALWYF